jgi:hypothetical protein
VVATVDRAVGSDILLAIAGAPVTFVIGVLENSSVFFPAAWTLVLIAGAFFGWFEMRERRDGQPVPRWGLYIAGALAGPGIISIIAISLAYIWLVFFPILLIFTPLLLVSLIFRLAAKIAKALRN